MKDEYSRTEGVVWLTAAPPDNQADQPDKAELDDRWEGEVNQLSDIIPHPLQTIESFLVKTYSF